MSNDNLEQNLEKKDEINFLLLEAIENSIKENNKFDVDYWMDKYLQLNHVREV